MKQSKNVILPLIIIVILILQLIFLYNVKYSNQGLSFDEFTLLNIGNLLNFIFTFFLITGLIIFLFQKKNSAYSSSIILFTALIVLSLTSAFYLTQIDLPFKKIYILNQTGNRLITGFVFSVYQFIVIVFVVYIWLINFRIKKFLLLRSVINSFAIVLIVLLFSIYFTKTYEPDFIKNKIGKHPNNVAVVLGAAVWSNNEPSPSLAARVDKALDLYKHGYAGKIQLTGSSAPGELTEAEVGYIYAVNKIADSTDIFIETKTTSTTEQMKFIKNNLINKSGINEIVVVSDEYHLVRIDEIRKFFKLNLYAEASDLRKYSEKGIYQHLRESIALLIFWFFAL